MQVHKFLDQFTQTACITLVHSLPLEALRGYFLREGPGLLLPVCTYKLRLKVLNMTGRCNYMAHFRVYILSLYHMIYLELEIEVYKLVALLYRGNA
jgi:hypothetical protein